jgi:hypothetical protein
MDIFISHNDLKKIYYEFVDFCGIKRNKVDKFIKQYKKCDNKKCMSKNGKTSPTPKNSLKNKPITKSMKSRKEELGQTEMVVIKDIVKHITEKTDVGKRLLKEFYDNFGITVTDARQTGGAGSRKIHYDFELYCPEKNEWLKIEHKGSYKNTPIDTSFPWVTGVQFYNGPGNQYLICYKYAKAWYNKYISSNRLKNRFNLQSEIPEYYDWLKKDAWKQGDPGTEFGKELKKVFRQEYGPRSSLLSEREDLVRDFDFTEKDINDLKYDAAKIANKVLSQKDYWLQLHGDVNDEFHSKWTKGFTLSDIKDIKVHKKKDITFDFLCENNFKFNGILRWGKGAGFSNIRLDLK